MKINIPAKFRSVLETLAQTNEGRFACVRGYSPSTNYMVRPVANIVFNSRVSVSKFYQRMLERLEDLTVDQFTGDEKVLATFEVAKAEMKASYEKTLAGDRNDAHRQGHDRCYHHIDNGIKIHLVTEKKEDGLMHPVLDSEGNATAQSIMLSGLEVSRTTLVEGVYKEVKSQSKTIMKGMIEKKIGANKYKTFSLKEDNFDEVAIDSQTVETADLF